MRTTLKNRWFLSIAWLLVAYLLIITAADSVYQMSSIHGEREEIEHEVLEIAILLAVGFALLPFMLILARRLSNAMLRPLENIRETADRIISGRLDERIRPENPEDELGQLARTINSAFDRYHEAMNRQQRFASDASHQLRTPLTSIRAAGEISLRNPRTPEEYRETIGSMLEDVQRLADVVDKLLMLARLGADTVRSSFAPITLETLVEEVVSQFDVFLSAKNIKVSRSSAGVFTVRGDEALLQQLLANLLDNAVRHTREGGTIKITLLAWPGDRVALNIRDDGPGVPDEIRERLFQRFARPTGADNLGSGIGLSIVAEIAALHGGEIELLEGPGANFRILLPVVRPASASRA